jgi:hypothetical protein
LAIDGGDPLPHGVGDTRIRNQQVFRLLDPQGLIIGQDLDGLPPEAPIDSEAEVVQPNLTLLMSSPGALTEREDAWERIVFL